MNALRTLVRLKQDDRALFFRALLFVAIARIGLSFFSFQHIQRLGKMRRTAINPDGRSISRFVWAIDAASRRIPAASCLTQSLALQHLLARSGHNSQVCIGVTKEPGVGFKAHAWVEYKGQPLLSSAAQVERYVSLFVTEGNDI